MWGRPPDLSYLRVLGSKAWVLIPKPLREHKFQARVVICCLVGYEGSNQYVLWDPDRDEIVWREMLIRYDNRASFQGEPFKDLLSSNSCREVNSTDTQCSKQFRTPDQDFKQD